MTECTPRPMTVGELRCGDMVHVQTWLGVDHWFTWGPARESWPVPGKVHVTKMGQGTHAVYGSFDDVVQVCSTGHCGGPGSLCAYGHRPVHVADPANPADAEISAAIERGLADGSLIDAGEWMARHAAELGR